jgi:hypothetical protein
MAIPWWVPIVTGLYHYGRHEEVREFFKERGKEWGEMQERRKEPELSPFPTHDPVTGVKYGIDPATGKGYTPDRLEDWLRRVQPGTTYDIRKGLIPPTMAKPKKRKITKSNKALGGLYKFLVKQQKGKNTQAKCRKLLGRCAKIIGKANPNTKSRIGKGSSKNQKLARKMRKQYWGTTKRN